MIMCPTFKTIYITVPSDFISTTQNMIKVFDNISSTQKQSIKEFGNVKLIVSDINDYYIEFGEILVIDGVLKEINIYVKKSKGKIGIRKTNKLKNMPLTQTIEALEEYFTTPKIKKKIDKIEDTLSLYKRGEDLSFDIARITDGQKAISYDEKSFYQMNPCDIGADVPKLYLLRSLDESLLHSHQCTIPIKTIFVALENLDFKSLVNLSAWFEIGISTQRKDFHRAVQTVKGYKRSNDKKYYMRAYRDKRKAFKSLIKKIIDI